MASPSEHSSLSHQKDYRQAALSNLSTKQKEIVRKALESRLSFSTGSIRDGDQVEARGESLGSWPDVLLQICQARQDEYTKGRTRYDLPEYLLVVLST